jgi:hypothetical protein
MTMKLADALLAMIALATATQATLGVIEYVEARERAKAAFVERAIATGDYSGMSQEDAMDANLQRLHRAVEASGPTAADYEREDRQRAALGMPPRKQKP